MIWIYTLVMKRKTFAILSAELILVAASLFVLRGAPLAYATGTYDEGYNSAKFDFLHHKSYNDSCHTDCTLYKVGYSEEWNTLNGWLGNR